MLHILLLILKIIGITLGILIGIVLLILCAALFIPVRYRIEANRSEGEGNPPIEVAAKVSWLLHFINARMQYSSELKLRLRVMFITIFKLPAKPKRGRKRTSKKAKPASKQNNAEYIVTKNNENSDNSNKIEDSETTEKIKKSEEAEKSTDNKADPNSQLNSDEEDTEQKLSIKEKLIKIWEFFKNIPYTIQGICDRIKSISENIEYYLDLIKGDMFQASFGLCKGELLSILSYIKPRKVKANLVIGAGDPAATGQIISYYYAILYPYIGSDVTIVGDFDNKRMEGTVFIKGKVKLFTFVKAVFRIYFNKDIKALLKLLKKED